jgi:hypothetical protein
MRFEIRCTDQATRVFKSSEELLDYDNFRPRAILDLRVLASNSDGDILYGATFVNSRFGKNLNVLVEGPPAIKSALINSTEEIFDDIEAFSAIPDPLLISVIAGSLAMLALAFLRIGPRNTVGLPEPAVRVADLVDRWPWPWSTLLLLPALIAGILTYRFWNRIFPMGTFAIGSGIKRHDRLENVRWALISSFIVTLIGGILLSSYVVDLIRTLYD